MKIYEDCKNSGIDWVGQVPSHWSVTPLKHITSFVNGAAFKPEDWSEDGTAIIRIENLNGGTNFNHFKGEVDPRYTVQSGDILFGWSGNRGTSFGPFIWTRPGRYFLNQHIFNVKGFTCDRGWFYWCLVAVTQHVEQQAHGIIGMVHVTKGDLGTVRVPLPPRDEQTVIASFLDRETGKIDALVEEQRRLIELLKEKRQAVISHAVTKGLDPNAKMKPSGVKWLGDVPEHWDVRPLKYVAEFVSGGTPSKANPDYWDGDVPWVSAKDLKAEVLHDSQDHITEHAISTGAASLVPSGSVVVLVRGMMLARAFPVAQLAVPMAINQDLKAIVRSSLKLDYLAWLFRGLEREILARTDEAGHGTKTIRMEAWTSMTIPVPLPGEQEQIQQHLTMTTRALDDLAASALAAIDLLQERRASLISAAVTGKIDVREPLSAPAVGTINVDRIRLLVAAEIVDLLGHKKAFGRVKLQKLLYLAEADVGVEQLKGQYQREAAGPLDRSLIAEVDAALQQDQHVSVVQSDGPGSQVVYRLRGERGAHHSELVASIGDRAAALRALIEKLGDLDTKSVEAVTTLYAVWNDALLDRREPTDAMVVSGVLDDWHPEKAQKFKAEDLFTWLGWMRRNKLVPRGTGPRTTTGRLFV